MKAKILLVEDSTVQAEYTIDTLKQLGYEVCWAKSGIEGLKMAKTEGPDLVILDVVMEDMDGYAVCRWLKVTDATRTIPVVMLTVKGEVEDRVEGLNVGADDYLPKPFDGRELEARIYAALRTRAAHTELEERAANLEGMLRKVEVMAVTDALTGLFNRRRFTDVLVRECATSKRYKNELSCVILDLDHFKPINDQHGHGAGDEVLKGVANILQSSLREVDVPARYGGDEFLILLPHTGKEQALIVAERIRLAIKSKRFEFDGELVSLTVSVGISGVDDIEPDHPEQMVVHADNALYRAKLAGRDRCVIYEPGMTDGPPETP